MVINPKPLMRLTTENYRSEAPAPDVPLKDIPSQVETIRSADKTVQNMIIWEPKAQEQFSTFRASILAHLDPQMDLRSRGICRMALMYAINGVDAEWSDNYIGKELKKYKTSGKVNAYYLELTRCAMAAAPDGTRGCRRQDWEEMFPYIEHWKFSSHNDTIEARYKTQDGKGTSQRPVKINYRDFAIPKMLNTSKPNYPEFIYSEYIRTNWYKLLMMDAKKPETFPFYVLGKTDGQAGARLAKYLKQYTSLTNRQEREDFENLVDKEDLVKIREWMGNRYK